MNKLILPFLLLFTFSANAQTTPADSLTGKRIFKIDFAAPATGNFTIGYEQAVSKTVSLDSSKVINVAPRYARLKTEQSKEIYGWQNIELISDRPFQTWLDEFKQLKDKFNASSGN